MPNNLLSMMADDLGILRMKGESDTRFAGRVSYSALRYWIQAYCLDDGYGGIYGISESAIIRKSTIWLRNLADLHPSLFDWYGFDTDPADWLADILRLLTNVRDIVKTKDGMYRCTALHSESCGTQATLILGLFDPTNQPYTLPLSGMATVGINTLISAKFASDNSDLSVEMTKDAIVFQSAQDANYVIIKLAKPLPNSLWRSQFDLLTWPIRFAADWQNRLARFEYAHILADLLRSNGIPCRLTNAIESSI